MRRGGNVFLQVQTAGNGGRSQLPGALARKPARPGIYRSPGDTACGDAYGTAHAGPDLLPRPYADNPSHTARAHAYRAAHAGSHPHRDAYRAAYAGAHIHRNPDGTAIDAHAATINAYTATAYPACRHAAAILHDAARVNGLTWPPGKIFTPGHTVAPVYPGALVFHPAGVRRFLLIPPGAARLPRSGSRPHDASTAQLLLRWYS